MNKSLFVSVAMCRWTSGGEGNVNVVIVIEMSIYLIIDSECITVVVKQKFVKPKDFTEEQIHLPFADGRTKEANWCTHDYMFVVSLWKVCSAVMDESYMYFKTF